MNTLDKIYAEQPTAKDFAKNYCQYLSELLSRLDYEAIEEVTQTILRVRENERTVYVIGNGGSAATASHIANDFAIGTTRVTDKPFRFISLTDNNAVMTCIANDFGYNEVFLKQLQVLMKPQDALIALSASGNSGNIINSVEYAKSLGNTTIGFSGFDGGKLREICDISINVDTPKGEYGPVEDIHMVLDHLISSFLLRYLNDSQ